MAITKPPVLPAWAESGDKVTPSNAEIQVGWPLSSIPPSRQRFNWLLNFLANGIRYFSRRGLPDYDAAETYMTGDRIIGDDGKTYRSLIDNNTAQTPSTSPTKWEEWAPTLSRFAALIQGQTYTAFTTAGAAPNFTFTPSPAIAAYAAGQRFRVKFHAAGAGSDVLNVSALGNKSLKQYDSTGAKIAAVIAANQLADIEYDGVDMVILDPLPSKATLKALDILTLTSNTALAAADLGKSILLYSASAFTVTLPAVAASAVGTRLEFFNFNAGPVTIQRSGTDAIFYGAASGTSMILGAGDSLTLESRGDYWFAVSGSAQLPFANAFDSNLATGWKRYPDKNSPTGYVTEQWGVSGSVLANSSVSVTFPIAFSNAILVSVATPVGAAINANPEGLGVARSLTGLTIFNWGSTIGYTAGVYWYVKGY